MSSSPTPPDEDNNKRVESHPKFPLATRLSSALNFAGAGLFVLPLLNSFVPSLNDSIPWLLPSLTAIGILLMPAAIVLVIWGQGVVWYNFRMTVPNPSPIIGLFIGGIALCAIGFMFSFVSYGPLFLRPLVPAFVFWIAMLLTTNEFKDRTGLDYGNMFALLFISYVFSVGAYLNSNCAYDTSEPEIYYSPVTKKEVTENKDHEDSYWLYIEPVADMDDTQTEVHESLYNAVEVGDSVRVNLKTGLWGSRWYYLKLPDGF